MSKFFTRERFGRPQFLAGCLLLVFIAECAWLAGVSERRDGRDYEAAFRVYLGLHQWLGPSVAGTAAYTGDAAPFVSQYGRLHGFESGYDPYHSPMWYLIASAPFVFGNGMEDRSQLRAWSWLSRLPYLFFGVMLGASLWYVSRRLYGNSGGYIALLLYCFSPGLIRACALAYLQPETGAAWGAFGSVFTAIAVSHTLYAPREVVWWNWRRILLLGLSLGLAIGSQFSLAIVAPVALGFMLYLAPTRKNAAVAIWGLACAFGLFLLFAAYSFKPQVFWEGLRHADFLGIQWRAYAMPRAYLAVARQLTHNSPALLLMLPAALVVYLAWPRARYFGNTAPLLMILLFLILGLGMPHYPGLGFELVAVPFCFVFVAGISTDLLETNSRNLAGACIWGIVLASAIWNVWELGRVGSM